MKYPTTRVCRCHGGDDDHDDDDVVFVFTLDRRRGPPRSTDALPWRHWHFSNEKEITTLPTAIVSGHSLGRLPVLFLLFVAVVVVWIENEEKVSFFFDDASAGLWRPRGTNRSVRCHGDAGLLWFLVLEFHAFDAKCFYFLLSRWSVENCSLCWKEMELGG